MPNMQPIRTQAKILLSVIRVIRTRKKKNRKVKKKETNGGDKTKKYEKKVK